MGVMSCARKGCTNIMCDIYIPEIGYICHECQQEFKTYLDDKMIHSFTRKDFKEFMETYKGETGKYNREDVDNFFSDYTNND